MNTDFDFIVTTTPDGISKAREIRLEVFVEEQGIPAHLDPDGRDDSAFHVLCYKGDSVVATGRLVADEDGQGVLARIAVRSAYRGFGLGRRVVQKLESVAAEKGLAQLSLQPHAYLEEFYASLGYHTVPGEEMVGAHALITMEKSI